LTCPGRVRSPGRAGRRSCWWAAELVTSWGSFLAGDQSGNRAQDGVEVLASAERTGQGSQVGQVADAVLDADSPRGVSLAFGLVDGGEGGRD